MTPSYWKTEKNSSLKGKQRVARQENSNLLRVKFLIKPFFHRATFIYSDFKAKYSGNAIFFLVLLLQMKKQKYILPWALALTKLPHFLVALLLAHHTRCRFSQVFWHFLTFSVLVFSSSNLGIESIVHCNDRSEISILFSWLFPFPFPFQ